MLKPSLTTSDSSLTAGVFIFFGLSGVVPATHYGVVNGWQKSLEEAALGWLILMGALYITGALLYALRIPERFFPGKLDIWVGYRRCDFLPYSCSLKFCLLLQFHSHQIFHCFVIAGAIVHYHGISLMAIYRLQAGECPAEDTDVQYILESTRSTTLTSLSVLST